MGFLNPTKSPAGDATELAEPAQDYSHDPAKVPEQSKEERSDEDTGSDGYQAGVRGVEAAATVWTKWHLVAAYGL